MSILTYFILLYHFLISLDLSERVGSIIKQCEMSATNEDVSVGSCSAGEMSARFPGLP